MDALLHRLRKEVRGEVRLDRKARILYSTDASLWQQTPLGVVLPRDARDVRVALEAAAGAGVPVLPRGGGTALGGQTTCEGALVLDFSRHMDAVLQIDPRRRTARIQPGIVLDRANRAAACHGLMFGPDVAPSNRATLGGMTGNNSCGAHSLRYGKAGEAVRAVELLLADGSPLRLEPITLERAREKAAGDGSGARVLGGVVDVLDRHGDEIERRYPKLHRRVSGYNLDALLGGREGPRGLLDLPRLWAGSEGTLAVATELTIGLVERPAARGTAVLPFASLQEALRAAPALTEAGAAAVEVLDEWLLQLGAASPGYAEGLAFLEGRIPPAVLLVEVFAATPAEVDAGLERVARTAAGAGAAGEAHLAVAAEEQAAIWAARKAGLGLLMSMKGDRKPVAFVEDTAVPPERLPDYMSEFLALVEGEGLRCAVYGHAAAGCLHTRPILAPKDPRDRERLERISEAVADLVLRHGGCMSGEHGDGIARSRYLERTYGARILEAFRELKAAFDPEGRMNPGKITSAPPLTERLRVGEGYLPRVPETAFRFAAEGGIDRAVELCNGMAACRKLDAGTMCPSFMALREEEHSTRGRANLLRAALDGRLPGGLGDPELHEALDPCLECKACKTECPAQVDMARLKAEALHQRHAARGIPLADRLLGRIDRHARLATRLGPAGGLLQGLVATKPARWLLQGITGIDRRRPLPAVGKPFSRRWSPGLGTAEGEGRTVALFVDTFTEHFAPEVAVAAVRALEAAGCRVVAADLGCCGRSRISRGLLGEARELALEAHARLASWAERGIPVVGLEPSCVSALRDDHLDLLPEADEAAARNAWMLEEILLERGRGTDGPATGRRFLVHTHCHQRALVGSEPTLELLRRAGAEEVRETEAGCCGMAGSFGYLHHDLSVAVAEDRLLPAVRDLPEGWDVVAHGFSCRCQIADLSSRKALHPAQLW